MKLLHITASYKPAYIYGGPIISVSTLIRELIKNRWPNFLFDIEIFTTTANGKDELDVIKGRAQKIDGVPVTYFNRLTKDHSHFSPDLLFAMWKSITTYSKGNSEFLIHIHGWWNLVSVLACTLALIRKVPVIISPRGSLCKYSFNNRTAVPKKLFHRLLGLRLLERCHFHVTTEKEKHDILRLLKPKSIKVIPNLVQLPTTSNEFPIQGQYEKSKTLKLLFLSRIEEKKGLDILLMALSKTEVPWTLSIAGAGKPDYVKELKDLARGLKLDCNRIFWLGLQNQHEKFKVLHEHDLLTLTSHDENFGNVVIESLYSGTAVLVSDKVGLSDYIKENQLGWVCKTDINSISKKLEEIYNNQETLSSISMHSKDKVKKDFSDEALIEKYLHMYKSIASQ